MKHKAIAFPIVGVGASAGGLESFRSLLGAIPQDSGMSYVLVQHLDPDHESILPEILRPSTTLPIHEIADNTTIEPNHIYIIPENRLLHLEQDVLKLKPREKGIRNLPIDIFFKSLAENHKDLAVGVVLSGSAQDGTLGLKAIKEAGGLTFCENPEHASWPGMPKSAMDAGVVDCVLKPSEIPAELQEILKVYGRPEYAGEEKISPGEANSFRQILAIMKENTGVDFNYYKEPTLLRRIARRMAIVQCKKMEDYLLTLKANKAEQEALFQDLLIQVSMFFRDPSVFEQLLESVIPEILHYKSEKDEIRFWVAGCATGEEAYSLAICLHEMLGGFNGRKIQIFASDISVSAIEKAREGIYTKTEVQALSDTRIRNYFNIHNGDFKVCQAIRDVIVFAAHNFLKDPPFAKMDLISCRNVFIYLDPYLQKKALQNFHYALREQGFLLLGKAETTSASGELFTPYSKHEKIYSRKKGHRGTIPAFPRETKKENKVAKKDNVPIVVQQDFRKSAESILMSKNTPPSVIVDEHLEVVHINGNVTSFLQSPAGKPTFSLMKMANEGLGFELRNALHKAKNSREAVKKENIPVYTQGEKFQVTIEVIPLLDNVELHYLIFFEKEPRQSGVWSGLWKRFTTKLSNNGTNEKNSRIAVLQRELAQAREDMRALSEDQEAVNEELQSANEELLSSNEEMQSLNEELETSKEELQSTNEELVVINHELIEKQERLQEAIDYSETILATLNESLVVLDKDFYVQSCNASYYKKYGGSASEIEGKSLFEIHDGLWKQDELHNILKEVLPEQKVVNSFEMDIEIPGSSRHCLLINARAMDNAIKNKNLILLAITDNTERKQAVENYQKSISELTHNNEHLNQFVKVASHDLQEPLRKILIFSNRLIQKDKGQFSPEMRRYLSKIETSSERMVTLIKDLLNYSRLAERQNFFEKTDLNKVLVNILEDLEVLIDQKNAVLNIQALPNIESIPLQMNQLFYNLINNALKFSRDGVPVHIEVGCKELKKPDFEKFPGLKKDVEYIELEVSDNGVGFDPKYSDKIFTIFQQLGNTHKNSGNGIGLALVKRIVNNHNGEIYADSTPGKGSLFHVILPKEQPQRKVAALN